jgi:hypothetical protein
VGQEVTGRWRTRLSRARRRRYVRRALPPGRPTQDVECLAEEGHYLSAAFDSLEGLTVAIIFLLSTMAPALFGKNTSLGPPAMTYLTIRSRWFFECYFETNG